MADINQWYIEIKKEELTLVADLRRDEIINDAEKTFMENNIKEDIRTHLPLPRPPSP